MSDRIAYHPVTLTAPEVNRVVDLLGKYQGLLEVSIDAVLREGERDAYDPTDQPQLDQDRRDWKKAEAIVKLLTRPERKSAKAGRA